MKFFFLISGNLKRRKLRTLLTLLSVLVAFLLYGLLCVIKYTLTGGVTLAHADRLFTMQKASMILPLPQSYLPRIQNVPGVDAVVYETWFGGIYQDPKNFLGSWPVEPQEFMAMFPEFKLPPEQMQKWLETRNGAICGRATANRFGWKVGDHIPMTSPIWGQPAKKPEWDFELVGIYDGATKGTDETQFFFRYDYFDEGRQDRKGLVSWYVVRVKNPDHAGAVGQAIDDLFANSPYETKSAPEAALMKSFAQQIGDIGAILISILGAVFFTILLVTGNTMAQSVRERTTELGVLKAMGFTNTLVLVLVLAESCLLTGLGGVAGLGAAWLITLGGSPVPAMLPIFYLPPPDALIGLGLILALGIASGIFPALQAMRLPVATALRRYA
jgi:putative ABC transport system permease protein